MFLNWAGKSKVRRFAFLLVFWIFFDRLFGYISHGVVDSDCALAGSHCELFSDLTGRQWEAISCVLHRFPLVRLCQINAQLICQLPRPVSGQLQDCRQSDYRTRVRHYRGATENVAMVQMRTQLA